MTKPLVLDIDPKLDLVLDRVVPVPADYLWMAWTTPEHLKQWFTPKPWQTIECEIDLKPGGMFRSVMRSPEGQDFPNVGCYLEVIPNSRLSWTSVLLPGFRPASTAVGCGDGLAFTAILSFFPQGESTRYQAIALHQDPEGRERHEKMGFHEGWGTVLDQLVATYKG